MGEKQNQPFQLLFNTFLKVDFQGSRVTSNGGLILVRELDERLGLEKLIEEHMSDSRQGLNKQFTLADLLWQSVYSRLAGYEDLNDAERLAADPTFRLTSSQRIWDRGAADLGATNAIWLVTPIAVTKSGAERGSSAECLRYRLRGNKRGASDGQKTCGRNPAACWGLL
jgi:DDE family transposase